MPTAPVNLEASLAAVIAQARRTEKSEAVCARAGGRWQLELWGSLPPTWAGSLALHCSGVGIDIAEGCACRVGPSRWAARFALKAPRGGPELHAFDFLRMARRQPSGAMSSAMPRLDAFEIVRGAAGIEVSVRGRDEPGFLAGVLQRFALFGMHAERLSVGSEGERAVDWFVVKATGGRDPAPDSVAALRVALNACLAARERSALSTLLR
ncbi:MAG TPA: hypothetical protein VFT98_18640 [Myxococcota bacterium]|nr:hypothetical protein [Myxococcota bacterium]